jgi:hypothetical protein
VATVCSVGGLSYDGDEDEIISSSWLFIISSPLDTPSSIFEYTSGDSIVWVIPTSPPWVADSGPQKDISLY